MLKVISLLLAFSVFFLVFGNGLQEGFKGIDITTKDDYELANVFRGDEFMTEFDYQKDGSVHEGYTTNYLDKKNPIQSIVGLNGNRFIVRADQESGGEGSVSLSSKKRWKSGLFVFSVNHVPQGRGVTGSIVFQDYDGSKLCGKQNVVAGPTHSARDAILGLSPINKIKWCGKSLMANSLNSSRGCSTYIWVFQLSPDKRSVDFWIFPISQAPLDLLNEKPVPSQWLQKPCTIQLTKCASPINGKPNTETSATLVAEAEGGDSYDVAEPTTLHREILDDNVEESDHYVNSVDPHFSV